MKELYFIQVRTGVDYFITKKRVFSFNRPPAEQAEPLISGLGPYVTASFPTANHCRQFCIYFDQPIGERKYQILYIIEEDGFKAYDLQTFMRLDDLVDFESRVEVLWRVEDQP